MKIAICKKIVLLNLFVFLLLLPLSTKHPLHFSLTNIEYNQKNKCVSIAAKLFVKDLSEAVYKSTKQLPDIITNNSDKYDAEWYKYFCENFSVFINDTKIKSCNFEFKRKKLNEDCIWLFIELNRINSIKKIVVKNTFFCSLFQDQTNLMIFDINQSQQSFNLSCEHNMAIAEY